MHALYGPASSGVDGPVTQQDDEPEAEAHELFRTLAPDDEPPQRPRSRLVAGVLALLLVASVPLIVLAAMPGDPGVDGALAGDGIQLAQRPGDEDVSDDPDGARPDGAGDEPGPSTVDGNTVQDSAWSRTGNTSGVGATASAAAAASAGPASAASVASAVSVASLASRSAPSAAAPRAAPAPAPPSADDSFSGGGSRGSNSG